MKRKCLKITVVFLCILAAMWLIMFTTDFVRCNSFKEPVFAVPAEVTTDDGGSVTYQGLGYRVEIEKHINAEYGSWSES